MPTSLFAKTFYGVSGSGKTPRQQGLRCDGRNPSYPKIDAVLQSPSLFFASQSKSTAGDFVELNEGLKEPRVGSGVAEVLTEGGSELVKSI